MAKKIAVPENPKDLPLAIINQMITLSTAGFGLVAALAWNELIKQVMESYVKPYMPEGSVTLSLFLYATIVTVFAVLVTLQLTRIQKRLEKQTHKENNGTK